MLWKHAPLPAAEDTIYDAASLTKVIATTTAVMQLVERGRLELDAPVARYLPAFAQHGKERSSTLPIGAGVRLPLARRTVPGWESCTVPGA